MNQSATGDAGFPFAQRTNWELTPNPLSRALEEHRRSGRELLDLTESNPTRCGLHYHAAEILKSFLDPANLSYAPDPQGWLNARKAVAGYYAAHGAPVDPASVLLTTGTSEGYNFLFRLLCDPGSEVLLPRPSYPLLDYLVGLNDLHARRYELIYDHGWHLDFGSLRAVAGPQSRAVVVIHPNNPTGSYVGAQERRQLNDFCRERRMPLIADEVFLDFALESPQPSFAANDVLTFVLSGISKISALPQMKLAWIVATGPKAAQEAALQRLEVIADTFLSLSTPTQRALPMLLEQRHDMIGQLRRRIAANLQTLDQQLARQQLVQRLAIQGGWYAALRVPAIRGDDDLALGLLQQHGVFVHPGHFYEFSGDGYLVLSLITPEAVFSGGVQRLLDYIG